jgi:hypothetical protein
MFSTVFAQGGRKQIIFAVLNDGRALEPIAQVEKGKIVELESGEENGWKDFTKIYYKPKTAYNLIFGGVANGKVTVVKSAPESDCAQNMAEATTVSPKARLKGLVMALATDVTVKKGVLGTRRTPLIAERLEIEKLVREELTKQKVSAANLKGLRYHNLTALDVNNDKAVEFVGSYWLPTTKTERAMLFFIAEKSADGKYALAYSDFKKLRQDEVMSGNIGDVDEGMLNELLLDVLDVDGDGTAEVFTIGKAFEGNNFNIYKRETGKWTRTNEIYNYHCGY